RQRSESALSLREDRPPVDRRAQLFTPSSSQPRGSTASASTKHEENRSSETQACEPRNSDRPHDRPFVTTWPRCSRHGRGTSRNAALTTEGGRDRLRDVRKDPRRRFIGSRSSHLPPVSSCLQFTRNAFGSAAVSFPMAPM